MLGSIPKGGGLKGPGAQNNRKSFGGCLIEESLTDPDSSWFPFRFISSSGCCVLCCVCVVVCLFVRSFVCFCFVCLGGFVFVLGCV